VRQQSEVDAVSPLTPPTWGGFLMDENGYAIAQHASDYSLVTIQNPAHAGETIIAYADGFFTVWPPPPIGFAVPLPPSFEPSVSPPAAYGLYLQRLSNTHCARWVPPARVLYRQSRFTDLVPRASTHANRNRADQLGCTGTPGGGRLGLVL